MFFSWWFSLPHNYYNLFVATILSNNYNNVFFHWQMFSVTTHTPRFPRTGHTPRLPRKTHTTTTHPNINTHTTPPKNNTHTTPPKNSTHTTPPKEQHTPRSTKTKTTTSEKNTIGHIVFSKVSERWRNTMNGRTPSCANSAGSAGIAVWIEWNIKKIEI